MTNCTGAPAEQFLESYLLGKLPDSEALIFEEHYFECPVCLAQVEALQAIAGKLRTAPRVQTRAPIPWPIRFAAVGAIAAVLVAGFFVLRAGRIAQQPAVASNPATPIPQAGPAARPPAVFPASRAVSQLADLALPAFRLNNLRGETGNPAFVAGMKAYSRQDCMNAVTELSRVPAADRDSLAARFFGGICRMHQGDLDGAAKSLRGVSGAGDSPEQEAALYYQAQIWLARNDAASAQKFLGRTVALHGDYERRARIELAHLRDPGQGGQQK
jgi:hypothetical protein